MGANFDYRIYPYDTQEEKERAKKCWNSDVEDSQYEDGNSYSGGIGMLGRGFSIQEDLAKESEAIEFLEDNHRKWDGAMAVTFSKVVKVNKSFESKKQKALQKIDKMNNEYAGLITSLHKAFSNRKSNKVGCKKCTSSFPTKYAKQNSHDINCPICGSSLLSDTDNKRIERANAKIKLAHKELNNLKPNDKKSNATKKYIVIGGWCSS